MANDDPASARYDLKDLADRAGVTPRTVHFYIQQGLLPPAGSPGPGARYSEAFLARLVLIRRLQHEHLPLAEIRRRLTALEDRAVIELAAATTRASAKPARDTSALEYVRSILGESPARTDVLGAPAAAAASPSRSSWLRELTSPLRAASAPRVEALAAAQGPSPPAPVTGVRSQWDRIVLVPDVELHVRRPLTREQNKRVERLLVAARQILQEEEQ